MVRVNVFCSKGKGAEYTWGKRFEENELSAKSEENKGVIVLWEMSDEINEFHTK